MRQATTPLSPSPSIETESRSQCPLAVPISAQRPNSNRAPLRRSSANLNSAGECYRAVTGKEVPVCGPEIGNFGSGLCCEDGFLWCDLSVNGSWMGGWGEWWLRRGKWEVSMRNIWIEVRGDVVRVVQFVQRGVKMGGWRYDIMSGVEQWN